MRPDVSYATTVRLCACAAATGACALLGVSAGAQAATAATQPGHVLSTAASPSRVAPGQATTVEGRVTDAGRPVPGEVVELYVATDPGSAFVEVEPQITDADGNYGFAPMRLQHSSRVLVVDQSAGEPTGPLVAITVAAPTVATAGQVRVAAGYLAQRAGTKAFAVYDSYGLAGGVEVHRRFHSASTVKSMLLVAYLQKVSHEHRGIDGTDQALLYPMIHSSSNEAATAVLGAVGEGALDSVATQAHMVDYEAAGASWGFTEISAADMARFFYEQESLIPSQFRGYARWLFSTIEPSESWGIPAAARPEFQVFFKGGWLPEVEGLVNQVARLEGHGTVIGLAVLTTHDPSMEYGEQTIEGVTARLIGRVG